MKVGIDLSELKNELKEIKKKNNNEKNQIVEKPIFDIDNYTYINFTNDPEVDDFLNDNSFKILNLAAGTNILLGTIFIEVQDYLSNLENADATYIKWLESNGFNRMTALRYKKRAEIYNSLNSSKAKYFIGITSQKIIDEISKFENRDEIIETLENMENFDEIEAFLKKDIIEIEEKVEKENIEIKQRIKKLPLKNIEKLDNEKQDKINNLVSQIEEILNNN
ncbi:hypothetical protein HMPREF0946_00928 [Fusobacterium vincentii 3_1_36A2]|jgi:hypothetical protein|uniref:Uncharacterized protein n=1 Tax=Fusobacterium vincentii 3_1_36A2 TaxID=469604 RepID=C7XPW2_FUSVC|nr:MULTISPECIES: hypothetical protein [Fusobacterium]EEU32855.1 hypothetical protein HMPREF0946_00928 [Fusobacterium vincentii 3_1_36A2]